MLHLPLAFGETFIEDELTEIYLVSSPISVITDVVCFPDYNLGSLTNQSVPV